MRYSADDYVAIHSLMTGYCMAIDWGDLDRLLAMFHPQASLRLCFAVEETKQGEAAVREWFANYLTATRAPRRYVRHKTFAPAIMLDDAGARGSMYFDSESIPKGSNTVTTAVGRYDVRFERDAGRWLFKEFVIVVYYSRSAEGFTPVCDPKPPIVVAP
ncbi:MAG: hypothetical protein BroJett024_37780 [Alphaproteobacteria bacterium]|nr:MAG: hypothetical protein BroJett024_37780 [Alphaproteobacteria bacterium]